MNKRPQIIRSLPFLALVLIANPVVVAWRSGYSVLRMPAGSIAALLVLDLCVLLFGWACALHWPLVRQCLSEGWRHLGSKFRFLVSLRVLLGLACCLVLAALVQFSLVRGARLPLGRILVLASWLQAMFTAAFLYFLVVMVLARLHRHLAWLGLVPVLLALLEYVAISYGGGRLSPDMAGWIASESVASVLSLSLVFQSLLILLPGVGAVLALSAPSVRRTWVELGYLTLFVLVLLFVRPVYWLSEATCSLLGPDARMELRALRADCDEALGESLVHLCGTAMRGASNIRFVAPAEYSVLVPANPVDEHLRIRPFRRVVFIACESLSYDFLSMGNPRFPSTLTPFLDARPGLIPIWTCSSPTMRGLASHFCSHPNAEAMIRLAYPNSLVRKLAVEGWRTVLFQSPDRFYDQGELRFGQMGFQEQYDAKWQSLQGRSRYVSAWGACDAVTLDSLADYLAEHRTGNLFIAALTVDMHSPKGRLDYADLAYPPEPTYVGTSSCATFLRSVWRFDSTLARFFARVAAQGLLDEDTVFVVTGDHSCPPFPDLDARYFPGAERLSRMPLFVVSGRNLPPLVPRVAASQLDVAPTLAELSGLAPDPAWWGCSLFSGIGSNLPLLHSEGGRVSVFDVHHLCFVSTSDEALMGLSNTVVLRPRSAPGRERRGP